jgi:hypothetical protein
MNAPTASDCSVSAAAEQMRHHTGVVIPIYLPESIDRKQGATLVEQTVAAYCQQVSDPAAICLSVDGEPFGGHLAQELACRYGTSLSLAPVNRGKLWAVRDGVRALMARADLAYVAVVDQDGDHFAHELLNFVWAAQHIEANGGSDRVLVIGRRSSRHRPMGFLRGELEEFADRVLLDALAYHGAISGIPLRLEYAFALDEFPDFHSGYKLFSRAVAEDVFLGEPRLEGVTEDCYYRHACEAVMTVEAMLHGGYLGMVNRSTMNEQPITIFGLFNLTQLVADKIIWPCRRLGIPVAFVRQWMSNHTTRLLLLTLAPEGREELMRIRRLVLATLSGEEEVDVGTSLQPLFV